mgnify:CR=1 FL=1
MRVWRLKLFFVFDLIVDHRIDEIMFFICDSRCMARNEIQIRTHTQKNIYIYLLFSPLLISFLFFLIQLTTFLFPFYSFIHSFIHSFIRSIDGGWGGSRDGPRSLVVLLVGTMYIYKNRQITRPIDNFTTYDYFLVRVTSFFSSFFFHRSL